jgi:ElaB/YqjD/DUF883 family membrane-anchored ribosome-binding protein
VTGKENAMNATTGTREPSDLERESSEIRADMDRTLDALERKFDPGQLLDRSLSYLREHGGEFTRSIGETVKENPVPVLLTAAGLAWLITSSIGARSRAGSENFSDPYTDETGLKERLSERLHERADAAKRSLRESRTAASGRVAQAMNTTRARAQQAQQRARTMLDEQPLVLGALALAAGAIVGAALPTTKYENRTVGPVRNRTLEKAKAIGERQYQSLRNKFESREDIQVSGRAN